MSIGRGVKKEDVVHIYNAQQSHVYGPYTQYTAVYGPHI